MISYIISGLSLLLGIINSVKIWKNDAPNLECSVQVLSKKWGEIQYLFIDIVNKSSKSITVIDLIVEYNGKEYHAERHSVKYQEGKEKTYYTAPIPFSIEAQNYFSGCFTFRPKEETIPQRRSVTIKFVTPRKTIRQDVILPEYNSKLLYGSR